MVVGRHAAGLAARGHDVTVILPESFGGVVGRARNLAVKLWDRRQHVPNVPLAIEGVTVREPSILDRHDLDNFDSVIATGHQTVKPVSHASSKRRFYFVQGDERELASGVEDTWGLPLTRVTVSCWLADLIESHGHPVQGVVPNGIDPSMWALDRAIERRRNRVIALYHRHPVKGPKTLITALKELRRLRPTVRADVFAARTPRHTFPSWVRVRVRPGPDMLRKMYNRAAVCLHTSRVEGWGMVPMEAAACGCAVVATASRGPQEYLTPGVSMTEVSVGDALGLAREAARLLRDPAARVAQARAGVQAVAQFRWDDSTGALERILLGQ